MKAKKLFSITFGLFISITTFSQQIGTGTATKIDSYDESLPSGMYYTSTGGLSLANRAGSLIISTNSPLISLQMRTDLSNRIGMPSGRLYYRMLQYSPSTTPWKEIATCNEINEFSASQTFNSSVYMNRGAVIYNDLEVYGNIHNWGDLTVRGNQYPTPIGQYGKKIFLGNEDDNTDPIWITRYNTANDKSDLRINIGDNRGGEDRFIVGNLVGGAWQSWLTILNSGKVGIGLENPGYSLDVNGTIRSKEIRVESGWADYVFNKDYKLPALSEVKTHIEEYNRLPGMPSAKEVKENGIGLSEATTLLLQKVEELTLYVIQQNEINEMLRNEIKELKNQK